MVLHTLNRAPHSSLVLADCLRVITPPAALLLIEDGTYAATRNNELLFQNLDSAISDSAFVTLTTQCERIQSWY